MVEQDLRMKFLTPNIIPALIRFFVRTYLSMTHNDRKKSLVPSKIFNNIITIRDFASNKFATIYIYIPVDKSTFFNE